MLALFSTGTGSDPILPALNACLDTTLVLESAVAGLNRIPHAIRQTWCAVRPIEALYHPGRYVRVVYAMLSDPSIPTERAWPEEELLTLFAPVRRPLSGRGEMLSVGGTEMEAYVFPNDRRLRGLRTFAHRLQTLNALREWFPSEEVCEDSLQRKLIRFVPEQKCVVRLRAEFKGPDDTVRVRRVGVRCVASHAALKFSSRLHSIRNLLMNNTVLDVPRVLGLNEEQGLIGIDWHRGDSLTDLIHRNELNMGSVTGAIRSLHRLPLKEIDGLTNADLVRQFREILEDLRLVLPDLTDELAYLEERWPQLMESTQPGSPVTLHNDLHPDQFLMKRGRTTLLDFERLAVGSADLDVANLAAQMQMMSHRPDRSVTTEIAENCRSEFLKSWIDASQEVLNPARFHTLCALSRLNLARGCIRHLRPWRFPFAIACIQRSLTDLRRAAAAEEIA